MAFYIFPNALTKSDCDLYTNWCLINASFDEALILKGGVADNNLNSDNNLNPEDHDKKDHKIRKTDVLFLKEEINPINQVMWGFIREANAKFFKYKLDYFQAIQFARYQDGGHYDWHQDSAGFDGDGYKSKDCRKLSLTCSLTDHDTYEGGFLQFYNGEQPFEHELNDVSRDLKLQGSVIVFDSRDWHRVTPVTKGMRYSLVCWTVGPNFV
jgi:PKHD-type hydroxylase